MRHVTVFSAPDVYAGWPANHGAWQWGPELLVGFLRGRFRKGGIHNIEEPFEKVLARSLDEGQTWTVEKPNVDFEGKNAIARLPSFDAKQDILRFSGNYDHGGEGCDREGAVYSSSDRGKTWRGPFHYSDLHQAYHSTSRTCVLGNLIFVSTAFRRMWGTDSVWCMKWDGKRFDFLSTVLSDDCRAVMPAAVRLSSPSKRIVVALRRRGSNRRECWVDVVWSDNNGLTWSKPVHVADTGTYNGNPPALICVGDHLYCAVGNRDDNSMWLWRSVDWGARWRQYMMLRRGSCHDIGYPRLFICGNRLVCVYYWSDSGEPQRIEATSVVIGETEYDYHGGKSS